MGDSEYPALKHAALTFPAIDNHAHPLLKQPHRAHPRFPFEGLVSEAAPGAGLEDAVHTLACFRATAQLAALFADRVPRSDSDAEPSWDAVKEARDAMDYGELCRMCMGPTGIQCLLIDDGLGGVEEYAENLAWHDQFTGSPTRRIVRVEVEAENIIKDLVTSYEHTYTHSADVVARFYTAFLAAFDRALTDHLTALAADPAVVGFKSVVCYRTGLDVRPSHPEDDVVSALQRAAETCAGEGGLRLAEKALNDRVVGIALGVAAESGKPVQFHTGLGDNDITLALSSPAHMQPIIKAHPKATFVLLHASYPYTRDAGYLAAVYAHVFLDVGEVFPCVSAAGQRAVIREALELAPSSKVMWSTDGHWWPESFYLGTIQAREAIYEVLSDAVRRREMTERQAVGVVERVLFHNANRVYGLGLEPLHRGGARA